MSPTTSKNPYPLGHSEPPPWRRRKFESESTLLSLDPFLVNRTGMLQAFAVMSQGFTQLPVHHRYFIRLKDYVSIHVVKI